MKKNQIYLIIMSIGLLNSCGVNNQLAGLWQIEKVTIGNEEMTPVAKWTRINKDKTQESGNGWNQHTIGTWEYDKSSKKIELKNTNGIMDVYEGFKVLDINKENMLWSRKEEGEIVQVYLKKIKKIPKAPFNELLGIWQLSTIQEDTLDNLASYLFLRWDNILIDKKAKEGKKYGMYKTHGHKNELQIIYYETPLREVKWNYSFNKSGVLSLEREENGKSIKQEYERKNEIPN